MVRDLQERYRDLRLIALSDHVLNPFHKKFTQWFYLIKMLVEHKCLLA